MLTHRFALFLTVLMGAFYVVTILSSIKVHSVQDATEAYSALQIVLTSHPPEGLHVFDDFREAYAWLSHNTEVDDKVRLNALIHTHTHTHTLDVTKQQQWLAGQL
uniref:Uncharacterized protein n=1 Tax=Lactuca sativa TaxID=4236 RepID=A0A9R1X0I8_LACSA|nr:hypothetical protein LSAT_V11C800444000 [Lactuca sativa]